MKWKNILILFAVVALGCISCQKENTNEKQDISLEQEIQDVLGNNISYDNIDICFDDIRYYDGQELSVMKIQRRILDEEYTYEELMDLYVETVFPLLLDKEEIDVNLIFDINTRIAQNENRLRTFEKNYYDILDTIDEYETMPELVYEDGENWTEIYYTLNWLGGVYITQGVLGSYAEYMSAFGAQRIVEYEKIYDCRLDDLSDTYEILDGEISLQQAKKEMEEYLNTHYPIDGIDNGIKNELYSIRVGKIKGVDAYAFSAYRTLLYNGIPFRELPTTKTGGDDEALFMGECVMCERNKLDVTIGFINLYTEPKYIRTIEEHISFQEVMDRVAYYLTGGTKFQLLYGGLEYRLFNIDEVSYEMVPYWCFIAKNPNDDSMIKIYVDMETGETTHSMY